MTIKEITELRKSGHLQEALAGAEELFAKNANNYTANALFWCLNTQIRQLSGEEAAGILERMKTLYADHCPNNELMPAAIATAEIRLKPQYQYIAGALEKAKNGNDIMEEHQQATTWFDEGSLDSKLYPDFGWLTYYALKHTDLTNVSKRKILLNQYLKLNLTRPSVLHSLILTEAVRVEHATPLQFRIRDFFRLWGVENLRPDDWEQFRTDDGKMLPSLVEKLVGVYTKELKTDGVAPDEEFCKLLDTAVEKYPHNQNMPYFKATVLLCQGKSDEALAYYKNMIQKNPSKFYLWNQTAELVDDIDVKIGLLCKALTCGTPNEFLGSVRLRLAALFIQKDLKQYAKYELLQYQRTYLKMGWHLKPEYWSISNQLTDVEPISGYLDGYIQFCVKADELIYSTLPTTLTVKVAEIVKQDQYNPKRKHVSWILRTENSTVKLKKPALFGLKGRIPNGTMFDIKMLENKIVWIKQHLDPVNEPWIRKGSGVVRMRTDRNGKKYTIIADAYVGEALLTDIQDGQQVNILAVRHKDNRWGAVAICND